jgi:hypothetical protein
MSAPFRIESRKGEKGVGIENSSKFQNYLEDLLKLIPAEVVALYLVGAGMIPDTDEIALVVWAIICLVGVVVVRAYGTSHKQSNTPVQWSAVAISTAAFVVWVYSIGGPFEHYDLHVPYVGSLLVLAFTFFVPIFYRNIISSS